jgi:hypothetical protein
MTRAAHRAIGAVLVLALCAATSPAGAQETSDRERAKASFKAGANAYAAGDYLAAIQALEAAYDLTPLPAIAFSLAQAERKQYVAKNEREHLERAVALFKRYLEQEPNGPRRADAQLALAELSPHLSRGPTHDVPAKPQIRPTRLMIVSDTPNARISLDGGPLGVSPLIREVAPGKHRARVTAAGYYDADRDVMAVAGELLLTEVRLSERPTSLYVWAPAESDIYVDGVYMARGGPVATLALPSGRHQLTVAQAGRRVVRRDIQLARGQTRSELVTLEPTTQRTVSEYLFVAGGAALGGSLVLSAFAVRSEGKAEDFLQQKHYRVMSSAELVAYHASIVERTRYRTAALVGVAGAAGCFITGLFLHELDRPSLAAAPRQEDPRSRESARIEPRFVFSPVVAHADLGASFQVNF